MKGTLLPTTMLLVLVGIAAMQVVRDVGGEFPFESSSGFPIVRRIVREAPILPLDGSLPADLESDGALPADLESDGSLPADLESDGALPADLRIEDEIPELVSIGSFGEGVVIPEEGGLSIEVERLSQGRVRWVIGEVLLFELWSTEVP